MIETNGAELLVRLLADAGVRVVAGIPGRTNYAFGNALLDEKRISPLTLRHESVGTFAADAYYRVSGNVMAVTTHTLAGTSNALSGLGNAYADSSAMLLIVGEEARESLGRGAYQELSRSMDGDLPQLVRHLTKRSWVSHSPLQLVEQTLRALRTATVGRPGPVALHVFADVWDRRVEIPDWPNVSGYLPAADKARPSDESVAVAVDRLQHASRPLVIAGNGVNLARAHPELADLMLERNIPVATTVTGKGAVAEDEPLAMGVIGWVGTMAANWAAQNADVILTVGCRLTETSTSSWQTDGAIDPARTVLLQSDIDPTQVANVFPAATGLVGHAAAVLRDLHEALGDWVAPSTWTDAAVAKRAEWASLSREAREKTGTRLPVGPIVSALRSLTLGLPLNIVGDVGKHHKWLAQQFEAHREDIIVSSMGAATMGIGPCGAVGAALGRPDAKTICWTGDGGMSMSLPVLPTVAEYGLPILYIVIDDGSYGAVVNSQTGRFGRTSFAKFDAGGANPDYCLNIAAVAEACGVPARRIERVDEIEKGLRWGLDMEGPALLDIIVDQASAAPNGGGFKLGDIWDHPVFPWARYEGGG